MKKKKKRGDGEKKKAPLSRFLFLFFFLFLFLVPFIITYLVFCHQEPETVDMYPNSMCSTRTPTGKRGKKKKNAVIDELTFSHGKKKKEASRPLGSLDER